MELEQQVVTGGQALQEKEREQLQRQREMQLQLRKQKKKEKRLLEEKRRKEEEVLLVEKHYKDLQEEVSELREVVRMLRDKYKAARMEIEDLQQESYKGKEELLENIRGLEREMAFNNKLIGIMVSENEMYKIKEKAQWDENRNEWKIPLFFFSNKGGDVQFPNINAQARVDQVKSQRDIQFENGED